MIVRTYLEKLPSTLLPFVLSMLDYDCCGTEAEHMTVRVQLDEPMNRSFPETFMT
jgi:hypothetical protein